MNTKSNLNYTVTEKQLERQAMDAEYEKNALLLINKQKLLKIDSFTGYFEFLHNNYLTPVYYEGILYPSVTHAYQASRSSDETTRRAILNAESFNVVAKIASRIVEPENWQIDKLKVMERLVRDKFRRSKELQEKLRTTENREILMTYDDESSVKNLYWGVTKSGVGQNQLGRILMRIREDLIADKVPNTNKEILNWITSSFDLVTDRNLLPEISLKVIKDNNNIDHVILKGKSFYKIGLLPENDLQLQHPSVSRLHAVIICDKNLGVVLVDLRSKAGTKLDNDLIKDHIPYRLKSGKKVNFAASTRDFIVDIDLTRIKALYEKEKLKLEEEKNLISQLDNAEQVDKKIELIEKTFKLGEYAENETVFLKNVPSNGNEEKIKELLEENFGEVSRISWPLDRDTSLKRNFMFVTFKDVKYARDAVEYGLISYEDEDGMSHMLKISFAENKSERVKDNYRGNTKKEVKEDIKKEISKDKRHREEKNDRYMKSDREKRKDDKYSRRKRKRSSRRNQRRRRSKSYSESYSRSRSYSSSSSSIDSRSASESSSSFESSSTIKKR